MESSFTGVEVGDGDGDERNVGEGDVSGWNTGELDRGGRYGTITWYMAFGRLAVAIYEWLIEETTKNSLFFYFILLSRKNEDYIYIKEGLGT